MDRHTLLLAALDCVMAPIVHDRPQWASSEQQVAAFGPDAMGCLTAARAVHIGSARLYRLDRDALFDLRHAIARTPAPGSSPEAANDMVALFDQSLAAILEARHARAVLAHEAPHPSPEGVDKLRARQMMLRLDDFGRSRGGRTGLEARSVAMVLAASGFLQMERVSAPIRPYVAEPLFTMMFGSEFISESPDEPSASWTEYLAAAARAIPRTKGSPDASAPAIGGGPVESERGDLSEVAGAVAGEMRALAADLPAGHLRAAVEQTVRDLATFDPERALTER